MSQQSNVLIIGTAVFIATWVIYLQHGWVTSDSILYFEMARLIAHGQWQEAVNMFKWPLYPSLIAVVHMATGLSIQTSAQCLSIVFFATSLWALMKIVTQLGGNQRAQVLAAIMLFGSRYIVGDIMPMSTRDQGYWAFMLLALWQLIAFYKHGIFRNALGWQIMALLATLFRIEGVVYMLILPLALLAFPKSKNNVDHISLLFWAYVLLILLVVVLASLVAFMSDSIALDGIGRLKELMTGYADIEHNINHSLMQRVDIMRDQVLGEPFKEYAWLTFLLSLLSISIIKCFFVAGLSPAILAVSGTKHSSNELDIYTFKILIVFALITWLIACLIIFKVNLLSGRYVILFGFVLIAIASVIAEKHLYHWKQAKFINKTILVICGVIVLIGVIANVLPKRDGYHYEVYAVQYVQQSLTSKQQAALYTSARQRFYANKPYEGRDYDEWQYLVDRIQDGRIYQYDFVVINLNAKADSAAKEIYLQKHLAGFKLDKIFYGHKKKNRTFVYRRIT